MKKSLVLTIFVFLVMSFTTLVYAQTISAPEIESPTSGSSFTRGSTFTLSTEVSCSGPQGVTCNSIQLTANLPSGLSTSSGNPQSCGNMARGTSCSKSWTINTDSAGTYSITVSASGSNVASKTSNAITVTVTEPTPSPAPTPTPTPTPSVPAKPLSITIFSPKENQTFNRGDRIFVNITVTSENEILKGGMEELETSTNFSSANLKDDGQHGDTKDYDGIFANELLVPKWVQDGIYELKIKAKQSGYQTAEKVIKININSSLIMNITLNSEYLKGEEIILQGQVVGTNNKTVSNSNITILIKNSERNKTISTISGVDGNFYSTYIVSFFDPAGNWTFKISAENLNNSGFKVISLPIITPPEAGYYYVKFTTPVSGITYSRGETVPVGVEITEVTKPVSNGTVILKTPKGSIPLEETVDGTYVGKYILDWDEPIGKYTIEVLSTKTEGGKLKGGGNNLIIDVKPAKLMVELLSPVKDKFVAGEKAKISARVLYPDGTLAQSVEVQASSPLNETIFLTGIEPGVYQATYKLREGEEGPWFLQLTAKDGHDNIGLAKQIVEVGPITIFYLLLTYWYFVAIGSTPFLYLGYRLGGKYFLKSRAKSYTEELSRIKKMKKDAQIKYFKDGTINRETYGKLLEEYEKRQEEIKSKLPKIKKK